MICLGFEPGAAGWKAPTNPLSYGGTPCKILFKSAESSDVPFLCIEPKLSKGTQKTMHDLYLQSDAVHLYPGAGVINKFYSSVM